MITNMFAALDKKELREIYDAIAVSREEGMRPRILDEYIRQVREVYPLSVGEAWKYTEQLFWEEIALRFFKSENAQ